MYAIKKKRVIMLHTSEWNQTRGHCCSSDKRIMSIVLSWYLPLGPPPRQKLWHPSAVSILPMYGLSLSFQPSLLQESVWSLIDSWIVPPLCRKIFSSIPVKRWLVGGLVCLAVHNTWKQWHQNEKHYPSTAIKILLCTFDC